MKPDFFTISCPLINVRIKNNNVPNSLVRVDIKSSKKLKVACESFAKFFKREMKYDFFQYMADEIEDHIKYQTTAYLFLDTEDAYRHWKLNDVWQIKAVGAVCFRKRNEDWFLDFIWVHPYRRRMGFLKRDWAYFEKAHGAFKILSPLSDSMESFLTSMNFDKNRIR